jgi:phosphate transport system permease protein
LAKWISLTFGWIPLLSVHGTNPNDPFENKTIYESSTFIAGIVVALMIMPIICSVMRESFSQAPVGEREGAFALGATRWGMIRSVVLPFGRGGMIGPFEFSALFAAGLALFMLTLMVNFGASAVIARTRSGALSDA